MYEHYNRLNHMVASFLPLEIDGEVALSEFPFFYPTAAQGKGIINPPKCTFSFSLA